MVPKVVVIHGHGARYQILKAEAGPLSEGKVQNCENEGAQTGNDESGRSLVLILEDRARHDQEHNQRIDPVN